MTRALFLFNQYGLGVHTLVGLAAAEWYIPVFGSTVQLPRNYRPRQQRTEGSIEGLYSMSGHIDGSEYHRIRSIIMMYALGVEEV